MEWSCKENCGLRSYVRTATCIACSNNTEEVCARDLPVDRSCMLINFKNVYSTVHADEANKATKRGGKGEGTERGRGRCIPSKCSAPLQSLRWGENESLLNEAASHTVVKCNDFTSHLSYSDAIGIEIDPKLVVLGTGVSVIVFLLSILISCL